MQETEIYSLAREGIFSGKKLKGSVEETHISWVILTRNFAFKIKKPVKLSFLDFTSLSDRKITCQHELKLNKRFTDIYISVLPVRMTINGFEIGGTQGKVVDYAVQMKKMAAGKRMDKLLAANRVPGTAIISLATVVSKAHIGCKIIRSPFDIAEARNLFNDIAQIEPIVSKNLEIQLRRKLRDSLKWNERFLKKHAGRFQARIDRGFKRDVHGDLHSGNIFLYKRPILFDCIEFNDAFRQIDVLYEVAFLCMDLEGYGMTDLAIKFLQAYNSTFESLEIYEDFEIFNYFKCLRANIRAKVNALAAAQAENEGDIQHHVKEMKRFLELMHSYILADDSVLTFG